MPRSTVPVVALLTVALAFAGCIGGSAPAGDGNGTDPGEADDGSGNATVGDGPPTQVRHVHDRWEGDEERTVFDGTVETGDSTDVDPSETLTENVVCVFICGSFVEFAPDDGEIVPPGTEQVTFTASWDASPPPGHEIYVYGAYMSANATGYEALVDGQLTSGETVEVNTTVPMADGGHAQQSLWRFRLFVLRCASNGNGGTLFCGTRLDTEPFSADVTVTAERVEGQLPPEPPHPDWWANGSVRDVGSVADTVDRTGTGPYYLHTNTSGLSIGVFYAAMDEDEHEPIPPGSRLLVARLNWTNDAATADAAGAEPWLRYADGEGLFWKRWEPDQVEDGSALWTMGLTDDMTDGMYDPERSRWSFYLGFTGSQGTGVDDPFLGEELTTPYRFEGSYDLTIRVHNTTDGRSP